MEYQDDCNPVNRIEYGIKLCEKCNGTGLDDFGGDDCPVCNGTGDLPMTRMDFIDKMESNCEDMRD